MDDKKIIETFKSEFSKCCFNNRWLLARNIYLYFTEYPERKDVISVDSGWGNGKTWFLEHFSNGVEKLHLINKELPRIFTINAWEEDHHTDPFVVLMSVFYRFFGKVKTQKEAGESIDNILSETGKGLIKLISHGALDYEQMRSRMDPDYALSQEIRSHGDTMGQIMSFREELGKSVKKYGRIIIAIDELDRCRPDFAVKMLERIHHFFGISGVHFLIFCDYEHLAKAVAGLYGPEFDGKRYLHRFFQYQINLPDNDYTRYASKIFQEFTENGYYKNGRMGEWLEYSQAIKLLPPLSLRDMERIMTMLASPNRTFGERHNFAYFLCLLKIERPFDLYPGYVRDLKVEPILDWLFERSFQKDNYSETLKKIAIGILATGPEGENGPQAGIPPWLNHLYPKDTYRDTTKACLEEIAAERKILQDGFNSIELIKTFRQIFDKS